MNNFDSKKEYGNSMETLWMYLGYQIYAFNSFSDSLHIEYGKPTPTNPIDCFKSYCNNTDCEYYICLSNCFSAATTLCMLYSDITKKDCSIRLNERGYIEMVETSYSTGEPEDIIILSGREYRDVIFNKGYSVETHGGTIESINSELVSMGINKVAVSDRDAARYIFQANKYIDIGYKHIDGGYASYIIAENGLELSLDKYVQYSEQIDAENEFMDFVDMWTE